MTSETPTPGPDRGAVNETITFVESYQPPIKTGTYTLTVTQEISGDGISDPPYSNTKTVYVAGERFSVDPSDIASVFPPDGNQGDHFNVLPHVVFARKTLPWERKSGPDPTETRPHTPKATPWLALLIFHDDDPPPPMKPAMVGDLLPRPFPHAPGENPRASTLAEADGMVSYYDAYQKASTNRAPEKWLEPGQNWWDPCLIVDVPSDLFSAIAPTRKDLGWLAHSREIRAKGPAREAAPVDETPPGEYSVIIANRLPKPGGVTTAYLVSLEGLADFLPDAGGAKSATLGHATSVRLVVLKAWSFSCTPRHETFKGYFDHLSYGPLQLPYAAPPQEGPDDLTVKNALAMGYAALNHDTRWGDRTVSWYRGPFLPFAVDVKVSVPMPDAPLSTADEALRYDPELGMLDVSYAAAWQLGRLMAVRDKSFAYALYQWKQEMASQTCRACHTARVNDLPHIRRLLRGDDLRRADAVEQPLPTEEVRARAFQFLAEALKETLLGLDGTETAR